jgi:hypothetical protein
MTNGLLFALVLVEVLRLGLDVARVFYARKHDQHLMASREV